MYQAKKTDKGTVVTWAEVGVREPAGESKPEVEMQRS